ncbi:hypothetical protein [Exiguobacterium sp. s21]|uniref:hypothetical protein n=1 Tax=Exiguobacterium sp. s21 TaxID=2751244 RepID=UPI001BEC9D7A|nr:hypothetical protein [Exiguobacterium sp. s21]
MIDTNLKPKQRQCEKLLRAYYTLPMTIENLKMQAEIAPSIASYDIREGQSHAAPSSPVEAKVLKRDDLRLKEKEFDLLKKLRKEKLHQQLVDIWDMRYNPRHDYNDSQVMLLLGIERKAYYKLRARLLGYIADVFGLWEDGQDE